MTKVISIRDAYNAGFADAVLASALPHNVYVKNAQLSTLGWPNPLSSSDVSSGVSGLFTGAKNHTLGYISDIDRIRKERSLGQAAIALGVDYALFPGVGKSLVKNVTGPVEENIARLLKEHRELSNMSNTATHRIQQLLRPNQVKSFKLPGVKPSVFKGLLAMLGI